MVLSSCEYMFAQLRQVVLTRLNLRKPRRGSEPARTLIKEFGERHSWIDTTKLSSDDATVMDTYSIAVIMGKGAALSDDATVMKNIPSNL